MPDDRSMLFISHANPEDNAFAQWLSLRLGLKGYPVWCDLTKLLGGERFWSNIEEAIRKKTIKFLFVLSRNSNQKVGPLDELELALKTQRAHHLADFVIPLWIDDLSSLEFNVRLGGINAIPFQLGWAKGLDQLLGKLEKSQIPKDGRFTPAAVADWWRGKGSEAHGVIQQSELIASNFYPVTAADVHLHRVAIGDHELMVDPAIPMESRKGLLASLAPFTDSDAPAGLEQVAVIDLRERDPTPPPGWTYGDLRQAVTKLFNEHWRRFLNAKQIQSYTFSGGQPSAYFTLGTVGLKSFSISNQFGDAARRQVIGYKTVGTTEAGEARRRYWHFSAEARATSDYGWGFMFKPHVLFSDDGQQIWRDDDRLHRARRSQCKHWWNDKWRDLLQATVQILASEAGTLDLSAGPARLLIDLKPSRFEAPVTYNEPESAARSGDGSLDVDDRIIQDLENDHEDEEWA